MDKRVVKILVPTVASGALLLLWYKRMMIAMPAVWDPWFLAACAAGFIACGFTLDRMRIGSPALSLLDNRRIVVACSAAAGAGSLFTAAQGLAGLCGAVIGGFAAASAFLVVCAGGLRALPPNLRGSAFAAVFFLAGFVNTSTDLTELPLLLVSGLVPNVVMAAACAVLAALVAGVWGASFNTRVVAVAGAVSDDGAVAYADACASDGTGIGIGAYAKTAAASSVASAGDAFPAGDRIPADVEAKTAAGVGTGSSTGFEPKGARIQPMSRLMALAIGCFVLMYVAVSLKDSVAYPVAVESIVDNGFIRYVELPCGSSPGSCATASGARSCSLREPCARSWEVRGSWRNRALPLRRCARSARISASSVFPRHACAWPSISATTFHGPLTWVRSVSPP